MVGSKTVIVGYGSTGLPITQYDVQTYGVPVANPIGSAFATSTINSYKSQTAGITYAAAGSVPAATPAQIADYTSKVLYNYSAEVKNNPALTMPIVQQGTTNIVNKADERNVVVDISSGITSIFDGLGNQLTDLTKNLNPVSAVQNAATDFLNSVSNQQGAQQPQKSSGINSILLLAIVAGGAYYLAKRS